MKTVLQIIAVASFMWWGLIGVSRLEPDYTPCHKHGDVMLRMMGFKS